MRKQSNFSNEKSETPKKTPPVCAAWWRDAAYSYEKKLPDELPYAQLTVGFVMVATDDHMNIAMNVGYDGTDEVIWPVDGLVIPQKTITKFKRIGLLYE